MRGILCPPLLALVSLGLGCSFIFGESGDPAATFDGGNGGGMDGGMDNRADAGPAGDLTRAVYTVASTGGDYSTIPAWKSGRQGNLRTRQQLHVEFIRPGSFGAGEMVTGISGCLGLVVRQSDAVVVGPLMTLELSNASVPCEVGETLTGGQNGAEVTVLAAGPKGVEEEVQFLDDSYLAPVVLGDALFTTDPENRLIVSANPNTPHGGMPGVATKISAAVGDTKNGFEIHVEHVTLTGFEITDWFRSGISAGSEDGVLVSATGAILDRLIIHDSGALDVTNPDADAISTKTMGIAFTVQNSVIYNIDRAGGLVQGPGNVSARILNNSFYQCVENDLTQSVKYACIASNNEASHRLVAINNIVSTSQDTAFAMDNDATGIVFTGSMNNACDDDNLPSTVPTCIATVLPQDYVAPIVGNLHLNPGGTNFEDLAALGADLPSFSHDIDGEERTIPWSLGADEADTAP